MATLLSITILLTIVGSLVGLVGVSLDIDLMKIGGFLSAIVGGLILSSLITHLATGAVLRCLVTAVC